MQVTLNRQPVYIATAGQTPLPGRPAVLFIHGAGLDHTVWTLFNRFFARQGHNTLAVDLPGHGRSGGEPLPTIEALAAWLEKLLEQRLKKLQPQRLNLVGHSMGGLVALELASRRNDIRNTVLLGVTAPMPVAEPLLSAAQARRHEAVDMIMLSGHAYGSQLGGNPVAGINILNSNMRLLERGLPATLGIDLKACADYDNGLRAAEKIRHPVSLVLGEEDKMTPPEAATALIDKLPQVQVRRLPQTGHLMLTENPEAVHQALTHLL